MDLEMEYSPRWLFRGEPCDGTGFQILDNPRCFVFHVDSEIQVIVQLDILF